MTKFYVPIVLGSIRTGRNSYRAARFIASALDETGRVETEVIDLLEADLPMMRERLRLLSDPPKSVVQFGEKIGRADALVVVSPEYNGGYPGVLKNALDYLQSEYKRKPVGLVTVSSGAFGGVRVLEQLRDVMVSLGALPIPAALTVPRVQDLFDEDGTLKDETFRVRTDKFLDELLWYTEAVTTKKNEDLAAG